MLPDLNGKKEISMHAKGMQQEVISLCNSPERLINYLRAEGVTASKIGGFIQSDLALSLNQMPICSSSYVDKEDLSGSDFSM